MWPANIPPSDTLLHDVTLHLGCSHIDVASLPHLTFSLPTSALPSLPLRDPISHSFTPPSCPSRVLSVQVLEVIRAILLPRRLRERQGRVSKCMR